MVLEIAKVHELDAIGVAFESKHELVEAGATVVASGEGALVRVGAIAAEGLDVLARPRRRRCVA